MSFEIPSKFPLSDLLSQELTQICIGIGEISLYFYKKSAMPGQWEPGATITIEAGFELTHNGSVVCRTSDNKIGLSAGGLTSLLRQTVASVNRLPKGELLLAFSSNLDLRLIIDTQGFESYHLSINGEVIDV